MYNLSFFSNDKKGISASDFENKGMQIKINLNFILSISSLHMFETPLSGKQIGYFSLVTMSNNDMYYIKENEYHLLISATELIK